MVKVTTGRKGRPQNMLISYQGQIYSMTPSDAFTWANKARVSACAPDSLPNVKATIVPPPVAICDGFEGVLSALGAGALVPDSE